MKSILNVVYAVFAGLCLLSVYAAQPKLASQFDFSSDTTPGARKFYFETVPGHRYTLWRSTDLKQWAAVPGYPKAAEGLSIEHSFIQGTKEFFQIEPIDDQAPEVVAQYPAVDGFAVGRFADLSIELSDASGIDPTSIRLSVGAVGPLASGAPGLTISGNTLTYDSGDAALGPWGSTLTATLVATDTLGHTLTHTWSFKLETAPQVAANVYVFGSPTAQRSGQTVSGPAAALAARLPAPTGPVKADAPPSWHIDSVWADRIVIAYDAGGAPAFTVGQLICNLAPTRESEIFYRRVASISNDVANLKLTVMTSDAAVTDFSSQGAVAFSTNSVAYELDVNGTLTRAFGISGTLDFPRMGYDLSGSKFKLRSDGYEAIVGGLTYSSGSGIPFLTVDATEYSWWITPRIRAGFEIDSSGLKSFEAVASGTVSTASVYDIHVLLAGLSVERTLYDLPTAKEPRKVIYLGQIGVVPVFATLGFDFKVKSKAEAKAMLDFNVTYRQDFSASFGPSYERSSGLEWTRSFQSTAPDLRASAALTDEFSFGLTLEPEINFLVYGLAGFKAGIEPSATVVAAVSTSGLTGKLEGNVDVVFSTAGPAFDLLSIEKRLSFSAWHGEWPIGTRTLAFKTQPQSKTVAPGADVSFTCTVDSPTTPTLQWYQNGRMIPGQNGRSLFLPNVTMGHAGSYFARAKAGGQTVDSDTVTLTVQAVTPSNKDTDSDGIPDIYETNTGTWVSITNTGTNPYKWDSDADGLSDAVETHTLIYVSRSNTGTDPNKYDTDGDGVNDKREIDFGTNPNAAPAPDGFVLIPEGNFQMGDQSDPKVGIPNELPVHTVYLNGFYMAKYEITKSLWDDVRIWGLSNGYTDLSAGIGKAANHPVANITWYDAIKWCNARSQKENFAPCYTLNGVIYKASAANSIECNWFSSGYRLPSEAEWEKAGRGGLVGQDYPWGKTITHNQANYFSSADYQYDVSSTRGYHPTYATGSFPYTSPVGSFAPNGYGLFDLTGNVSEWCWDLYGDYASATQTNPHGSFSGPVHIYRGGAWDDNGYACGVSARLSQSSARGFRIARSSAP